MVVWLIGLSGAGKTTLANKIVREANKASSNTVLIDGDVIRDVFGNDLGYSLDDRRLNAQRICQLGKFLDGQGINVVCAILSIFPETRDWNRQHVKNYFEVFIDTPLNDLVTRDTKGLYGKFNRGEISDVAGMDIEFPTPMHADLVIDNSGSEADLLGYSEEIVKQMLRKTI
jgi:adenylylsulfate kinase-like enzyme